MQDMVTAANGKEMATNGYRNNFGSADGQRHFGLRSVTKIVKMLNAQHNSELLTFKKVSKWLIEEGYWSKESGRLHPTEKGVQNGMSMQKCCLNGREFESVYCDGKMQAIISGKFSGMYSEEAFQSPTQIPDKMAATWQELAESYYAKGCYKEAADCYRNMLNCLRP